MARLKLYSLLNACQTALEEAGLVLIDIWYLFHVWF